MSDYPKLLIQKSKHYTSHFLLKSEKDKNKIALKILKSWTDMGYLYLDKDLPKTFTEFCTKETGFSESELQELDRQPQVAKLKVSLRGYSGTASIKEEVKKLYEDYKSRVKENNVVLKAKEALKNKDGQLAWAVVKHYQDSEYMSTEEVTLEEF
jgi:hypothetical protein